MSRYCSLEISSNPGLFKRECAFLFSVSEKAKACFNLGFLISSKAIDEAS